VAIITKSKPKDVAVGLDDGGPADADRLIRCSLGGVHIVNTYVPQGRDVKLPVYQYKLEWLSRLAGFFERHYTTRKRVLWCGDLNVAPTDIDVHDPKRLEGHVCFNPEVRAAFQEVVGWGLVDVFRQHHADEPGLFTFYDYRAPSALKRNKGWRIDHILATKPMARRCVACDVDLGPRRAERPSDHTVLIAEFAD
jgi:exodeoxyribonuclease-3